MSETQVFGKVKVERLTRYSGTDLDDLCEATESAIVEGGGFGWLKPPPRQVLENYWKGVLLVPERRLVVGRLDGMICGSAQLSRAPRNNEAQAMAGTVTSAFVAPWARGHGIGRRIVSEIEQLARELGLPPLAPAADRVMVCGSPAMLADTRALLDARGFTISARIGEPGDYLIERAFATR